MNYLFPQFRGLSSWIAFKIPCLQINTMSKKAILQIQICSCTVSKLPGVSVANFFSVFVFFFKGFYGIGRTIWDHQICTDQAICWHGNSSHMLLIQGKHLVQMIRVTGKGLWENPLYPLNLHAILQYLSGTWAYTSSFSSAIMLRKYRQNIIPLTRQGIEIFICALVSSVIGPCVVFGVCLSYAEADGCLLPLHWQMRFPLQVHRRCRVRPNEGNARVLERQSIRSLVDSVLMLVSSPAMEVEMLWRTVGSVPR